MALTVWRPGMRITADRLNSITPQYQEWDLTWTASSAPSFGSSEMIAKYMQVGRHVNFYINIKFASDTNFGSGNWFFGLPVPALSPVGETPIGTAFMFYTDGDFGTTAACALSTPLDFSLRTQSAGESSFVNPPGGAVDSLQPFDWANAVTAPRLAMIGQYETEA